MWVPAQKGKPMVPGEKLVTIESMPEWARPCFQGYTELNRVQSRLYDIAFGSDENVSRASLSLPVSNLLCRYIVVL